LIILTCANVDKAGIVYQDPSGINYEHFSFRAVIEDSIRVAKRNGYTPAIYDLGNLGIGEKYVVKDRSFAEKGYYSVKPQEGYTSRSLFKPELVADCLNKYRDWVIYLDGDAQLVGNIDEIQVDDYDVGVTVRKKSELLTEWHKQHCEVAKFLNAGVIFFNYSRGAIRFVAEWTKKTQELNNDQKALNFLACPEEYPELYSVHEINGVRIKYFPALKYNYYYFDEGLVPSVKIYHFKGVCRKYYPFSWHKKLWCLIINNTRTVFSTVICLFKKK
jgi:hypothetical protein